MNQQSTTIPPEGLETAICTGRDMPLADWRALIGDPSFGRNAMCMVWQSDGRRFSVSRGGICRCADGQTFEPAGPVSLAHPVEMDAWEILHWRHWLLSEHLIQPVLQMMEPVVLKAGRLPGEYRKVVSAGAEYEMCDRYEGYHFPLRAMPEMEKMGCRFVVRKRWDESEYEYAEIEVVHIITPAGIVYGCKPCDEMEELDAGTDGEIALGLFYPFPGIRIRTLNHVAARMEMHLRQECLKRDDLEMLLPHLSCMTETELHAFFQRSRKGSRSQAMLKRILMRYELHGRGKTECEG